MEDDRKNGADDDVNHLSMLVAWESQNPLELEVKRIELNAIEDLVAQKDLELATLQGELHAFELRYLRVVGVYFAELDDIRAKIAEALAQLHVEDERLREEAERARAQAQESADASETASSAGNALSAPFKPSAEIKTLFRDIAKRIHPDLGIDEADRLRRHHFMAEANKAYRAEDGARLQAILGEWEAHRTVVSKGPIARLQQILQKISQAKEQLRVTKQRIEHLQHSDMNQLRERAEEDEKDGNDLFVNLSEHLQNDIIEERERLREILQRSSGR